MPQIKPDGVGEEYGNARKAERLTHLDPRGTLGILEERGLK